MTITEDRPTSTRQQPTAQPTTSRAVPKGWGSHEERSLVLWAALGFLLLGLYAVGFVLVGHLAWS